MGAVAVKPDEKPLLPQQLAFVHEYCTGEKSGKWLNAFQAAVAVGYADGNYGNKLMMDPRIRAAIDKLLDERSMQKGEILARMTEIARADYGAIVDTSTGGVRLDVKALNKVKHLLQEFGYDSNGNPKFKFHDSAAALRDLAKARGLNKEGLDVNLSGTVEVKMKIEFVLPQQPPEWEEQAPVLADPETDE